MMKKNIGTIDKILRIIIGLALVAHAIISEHTLAWIGVIPLLTGLFGVCPLYSIFKCSTCKDK